MLSEEGEKLSLKTTFNPKAAGGNVEKWFIEAEAAMRETVRDVTRKSFDAHAVSKRIDWVLQWPGQVLNSPFMCVLHLPFSDHLTPVSCQVLISPLLYELHLPFGDHLVLFMPIIKHFALLTSHCINLQQQCYACPRTSVMTFAMRPGLSFRLDWISCLLVNVEHGNVAAILLLELVRFTICTGVVNASLTSSCAATGGALCRQHVLDSGGG
jgi:hypothetical protein